MSYQIINNGASIKFISEAGQFLLPKEIVKQVAMVRDDIIKIVTGDCSGSIFIHHRDVSVPATGNTFLLFDELNVMLNPPEPK